MNAADKEMLFTIGYSNFKRDEFIKLLKKYHIEAIADVRSHPFSKFNPDFNRDFLKSKLGKNDIKYVFLGDELGARRVETDCYVNGKVSYPLVVKTSSFKRGISRLLSGIEKMRIVLLCAEKDPINCHRFILICHNIKNQVRNINHILRSGDVERNLETENRLLKLCKLNNLELFRSDENILEEAYQRQGENIAYKEDGEVNHEKSNEEN